MSFVDEYVGLLRKELESLEARERSVDEVMGEFVEFVSSDRLFSEPGEFRKLLYRVQSLLGEYIAFLLRLESGGRAEDTSNPVLEEGLPPEKPEEGKSRFSRLLKALRRAPRVLVRPKPAPGGQPTIEYGRRLLQRIDDLLREYRHAIYLIREQDTDGDRGRLEYLKHVYQTYIVDLASDVQSFVKASLQLRKREVEKALESIARTAMRG